MKRLTFLLLLFVVGLAANNAIGQSQSEKDRAKFIANTKLLERTPFDPNAKTAREWGFLWLVETKDVSVSLCSDTMKLIPEKKNKFKSEQLMQFSFGMAVFKLENPDKKDNEKAAQLAGVESVLRTYQAMVTANEKAKNEELDALVMKQNNGELKAVVDAAYSSGSCDKKPGK